MSNTYEKYLYAKGLSDSTVKHYHKHTLDFIAWLDAQGIEADNATAGDITAFLNHLKKKGLANFTRSIQLNVIRHFFDYQIEQQKRSSNPAKHLKIRGSKRKTLHTILSSQELESIYHNYQVPAENDPRANRNWFTAYRLSRQRNKTIIGLMIWQGVTTPEINHLKPEDVKLREGKIYIAGGRKSEERTLELKPQQIIDLMEYSLTTRKELLKYCNNQTEYFYISTPAAGKKTGTGKETVNIWKRLSEEVRESCSRFVNFKQVRASVITHWLSQHNLRQVQYMAGHRYVSSTEAFKVNDVEDLKEEISKYHPIS